GQPLARVGLDDRAVGIADFLLPHGQAGDLFSERRDFDLHRADAALPFGRDGLGVDDADAPTETGARQIRTCADADVAAAVENELAHVVAALLADGVGLLVAAAAAEDHD